MRSFASAGTSNRDAIRSARAVGAAVAWSSGFFLSHQRSRCVTTCFARIWSAAVQNNGGAALQGCERTPVHTSQVAVILMCSAHVRAMSRHQHRRRDCLVRGCVAHWRSHMTATERKQRTKLIGHEWTTSHTCSHDLDRLFYHRSSCSKHKTGQARTGPRGESQSPREHSCIKLRARNHTAVVQQARQASSDNRISLKSIIAPALRRLAG